MRNVFLKDDGSNPFSYFGGNGGFEVIVAADDFSGASEVAGAAWRFGLKTMVALGMPRTFPKGTEALSVDLGTRALDEMSAEHRWREFGGRICKESAGKVYKKTDSVLRGHVATELRACLSKGPWGRALLVPANPERGRTILEGRYRIDGVSLNETEFGRDPGCPMRTESVAEIVRGARSVPIDEADAWSRLGMDEIVVGDTESVADLSRWARVANPETLPAGGSPFFASLLRARGLIERKGEDVSSSDLRPTLLVSGSRSHQALGTVKRLAKQGCAVIEVGGDKSSEQIAEKVVQGFGESKVVVLHHPLELRKGCSAEMTLRIAAATKRAWAFLHAPYPRLYLEGGETASAVLRQLKKIFLGVAIEWEPGVVTLSSENFIVTIKPGSYSWPQTFFSTG